MEYTREQLISILERAVVPHDRWSNRDTYSAQTQAGQALFLLKAGCDFRLNPSSSMTTNDRTVWVEITARGFAAFDYDGSDEKESYYIPTEERLKEVDGGDWY